LGVWKSTNGGLDWVQLFPQGSQFANLVTYNFAASITMDPDDHRHLVVAPHGNCAAPYDPICQAESFDAGGTWSFVRIPGNGWEEQAGPYLLNRTTVLQATLFSGIFLTQDNGAHWIQVNPQGVSGATGGEYTHRPFRKASDGYYYVPSFNQAGVLRSTDAVSWQFFPLSGMSYPCGFAIGDGHLYVGELFSTDFRVASLSNPSVWTAMPAPSRNPGSVSMEYDETHHILYSSSFTSVTGIWRMRTQ
jgi:hypothetical protein